MSKKKKIIIITVIVVLVIIIGIVIYLEVFKKDVKLSKTSVDDININVDLDRSDEDIDWSKYQAQNINLTKSINITSEGVYNLTGSISDGAITISTNGDVLLSLDGVTITNNEGPAIYVEEANTVVIKTVKDTTNTLTDGSNYVNYEEDIEGAIYSKDDLVLEGDGTLIANGNKGDAIVCKDDLKINSGTYQITANDDAIRGKDSVYILNGTFNIDAKGDGIKSTNDTDNQKGYINILNGEFNIKATLDGIQAQTKVIISAGNFNITTNEGASNSSDMTGWGNFRNNFVPSTTTDTNSAKGIKALDNLVIKGGTFNLNTSDDAIHSNNYVGLSAGVFTISSGDDGVHADKELVIDGGVIEINKSYEGLEAETITINDGTINIISRDDGVNAAGGADASGMNRPGNMNTTASKSSLTINGGKITVDATGDGLDANGIIYINGGDIIVNGPTDDGNGSLDYDEGCIITGGNLIALASSGMAEGLSNTSSQYGILVNFTNNYPASTTVSIIDSNNNEIMNYQSIKSFSSLVYSSNNLTKGNYTIKINNEVYQEITITDIFSSYGSINKNNGGMHDMQGKDPNNHR